MKWLWTPPPKHLQTRHRTIFAWFPRSCVDGYVRWLEWLVVTDTFYDYDYLDGGRWVEISARVAGVAGEVPASDAPSPLPPPSPRTTE